MIKKIFWLLVFMGLTCAIFSNGSKERQIDIYYSASLNGNLDGCECKGNPRSGLVKRASFLRTIDKESSLLLELGDIFDVYEDELLSDYILESYQDLGYDVIAVGDQEFSNGTSYLTDKLKKYPFMGNNLSIRTANGSYKKVTEEALLIARGGLNISILTIIDPDVFRFYPEDILKSIKVEDPISSVKALLEIPKVMDSELKIVLYHGALKNARKLVKLNPSINIIIAGHEQQIVEGEMIGKTIIVSPGGEGNMLGHLRVLADGNKTAFENSFIPFDYMEDPDDDIIRSRIDEYNSIMKGKLKQKSILSYTDS